MNCVQRSLCLNKISQPEGYLKVLKIWKSVHRFEVCEDPHGNSLQDSKVNARNADKIKIHIHHSHGLVCLTCKMS